MNYNKLPRDNAKHIKLNELKIEPIQHFEFLENIENPMSSIVRSLYANVVDMTDKAICEAVINYAKNEGATDVYLIDKEFVNKALINELSRMAYENEEKKAKEMGFIRVKPNLPKPHKPQTNFDKISENEVTLAKFIIDTVTHCQFNNCEDCPLYEADGCSRQEKVKEWLQKEMEK